jgi:MFS family permease
MPQPPAPPPPSPFERAGTLRNRTFIGLLIAQFLAAFNDQAIHASAMFFAINKKTLTEESAISLMPILFFAPWAIFCTLAGYFADKYSKRTSLVFWKFAEIGITAVALLGFILGSECNMPNTGVWIVLSTVFLMGTHSTFFVPAKYGAMPEILDNTMLSKGNGVLESLSFLATIFGTVSGGFLSYWYHDDEYIIGIILVSLAIVGALASLMIRRMPAANTNRPLPKYVYLPLWKSLKSLIRSKPLAFALVGIAFFTFMLAYMRAAVYMLGESRVPRWTELETSGIVGMTALGIGLGSPLAGYLSGKKVELGLIPIGAVGMILTICLAAFMLHHVVALVVCIILIGFFTGFYLIPMFTQLQHRAPKEQKGEVISTSNFTNVVGAILSSVLFFFLVWLAHHSGLAPLVTQVDIYTARELTVLQEDKHHRVVFFRIEREDGVGKDIGVAAGPILPIIWAEDEDPDNANPTILISQKASTEWSRREDAEKEGRNSPPLIVTVSKYVITDGARKMPHYCLRLSTEPQRRVHDNRELPRYLFFGAALMTLGVLLILLRLLPDLWQRTGWVLRSLRRERLRVEGIRSLPGHGGVLLASDAALPETQTAVRWASDRLVHFLSATSTEKDLQVAEHWLKKGGVVALTMNVPGGPGDRQHERLSPVPGIAIIPVHAIPSDVKFGAAMKGSPSADEVRAAIEALRVTQVE